MGGKDFGEGEEFRGELKFVRLFFALGILSLLPCLLPLFTKYPIEYLLYLEFLLLAPVSPLEVFVIC